MLEVNREAVETEGVPRVSSLLAFICSEDEQNIYWRP